jgi:hypothetical protein
MEHCRTPDKGTKAERKRRNLINAKLRRQEEAKVLAQVPDEETKEDYSSEHPNKMLVTEDETRMQRK